MYLQYATNLMQLIFYSLFIVLFHVFNDYKNLVVLKIFEYILRQLLKHFFKASKHKKI